MLPCTSHKYILTQFGARSYILVDAAVQQSRRYHMPVATRTETHPRESSFVSILSGWAQQGVQTFFATQRIMLDLAMRQNANVMHAVREQLSDPHHSPSAILSEVAGEGMTNFIEGQKILLELGKQQNEILMNGVRERVGDCPRRLPPSISCGAAWRLSSTCNRNS